jgi:Zn finger protein HypA/HybF involved in hydrogenase expression
MARETTAREAVPAIMATKKSYKLECRDCGHIYGANGCDIHERLCPECQGRAPGIDY